MLAFAGVVGLWAIAFFAPDLTQTVLKEGFRKHGYEGDELKGIVKIYASWAGLMTNVGAFFGMFGLQLGDGDDRQALGFCLLLPAGHAEYGTGLWLHEPAE